LDDKTTTWIEVSRSGTRKAAEEHALVLEAQDIPSGLAVAGGEYVVIVRLDDAARARAEIDKFVRENQGWPPRPEASPPIWRGVNAAGVYVVLLLLIDVARRRQLLGLDWWHAGYADARLIQNGEWWRSLTALCLHADLLHLAGNLLFGVLFGVMLAQSIGFGLAWLGFVVTGGFGNWLNAWLQNRAHTSVGASTAVFGMLGLQVASDWVRRGERHNNLFRRWAPVAMGIALLAWLGGGERPIDPSRMPRYFDDFDVPIQRIDVLAHVLGFAAGLGLGAVIGSRRRRIALTTPAQTALAGTALGVVVLAWLAALR
jgi:membrane associated rhomboid family serine protease